MSSPPPPAAGVDVTSLCYRRRCTSSRPCLHAGDGVLSITILGEAAKAAISSSRTYKWERSWINMSRSNEMKNTKEDSMRKKRRLTKTCLSNMGLTSKLYLFVNKILNNNSLPSGFFSVSSSPSGIEPWEGYRRKCRLKPAWPMYAFSQVSHL